MQTLYLIRGIPGSGKSTLAEQLRNAGIVNQVLEADAFFNSNGLYTFNPARLADAHEWCQFWAHNYLGCGLSVAVSNTSTTEKEVAVYQQMANRHNSKFVSLVLENRHGGVNLHGVPEEKLQQMKNRFSLKL